MSIFEIIVNFTLVVVCFVMGIFFLIFVGYKYITNKNYKTSLKVLSISYLIMGVLNSLDLIFELADYDTEYFPFLIILISSLQAILFTFSLNLLLNPQIIISKRLKNNLLPIGIVFLAYLFSLFLFNDIKINSLEILRTNILHPTIIIRLLFFGFYLFQLVYYTIFFLKNVKYYKKSIGNFFSETETLQLIWVRVAFFSALGIGIGALVCQIFPNKLYNLIISMTFLVYYFLFAVYYLNYNKLYQKIKPIFVEEEKEKETNIDSTQPQSKWESLKSTVIANKLYLKEGITLEELAKNLLVARTTLSNLINKEEGVNYNTWINRLRIKEAQNFFLQNPDYTIFQISQLTGFSEQSNFSRQFKIITGKTPTAWKKENSF